jgi:hypothetical protein
MTELEEIIFNGLSEYSKSVMQYNSIIMKSKYKGPVPDGYIPEWMIGKINYLEKNGFTVDKQYLENEIIVESDVSNATFEQRLRIWDLQPHNDKYSIDKNPDRITCLTCNKTSYNINDVNNLYCGHCQKFHD